MMKKTFLGFLLVGLFVAAFIGPLVKNANAIPPFARKYQTACTTCHTAFPKLNPFGMAFRAGGYRMPGGDEMFVKDEPIPLGAPAYKRLWPNAVWPSDLPYLPPVGFTMFTNFWIAEDSEMTNEFDGLEEFAILLGGTLGESFSFFMDWHLWNWGQNKGWLDRAFIVYKPIWLNDWLGELASSLFNIEEIEDPVGIFNVRVGQFEPRATPMLGGHRNLITMKGTPTAVAWPVAPIGNMWGFFPNQKGIEFFGALNGPRGKGGFEWAAGIVNGEQSIIQMFGGQNDGRTPTRELGRFDDNDFKDFYGRLSYKIGGLGVMGGGEVEESLVAAENWQDDFTSVKFGVFYYRGKSDFRSTGNLGISPEDNTDYFSRYGVDVDWIIWNFNVLGSAVVYDDNLDKAVPYNSKTTAFKDGLDDDFKTYIYTAEVDWVAYPWLMPAVRYEWIQPDYRYTAESSYAKDSENPVTTQHFERLSFDIIMLLRANVKLVAGGHFSIGEPPPSGSHWRDQFRIGLNVAF